MIRNRKLPRFRPAIDLLEGRSLMALTVAPLGTVSAKANVSTGLFPLASFQDSNIVSLNYSETISWGDGMTSQAVTQVGYDLKSGPGLGGVPQPYIAGVVGRVLGTHTYRAPGTYQVGVTVDGPNFQSITTTTIASVGGKAGAGFNVRDLGPQVVRADRATGLVPVALFTESGSQAKKASAYKAQINWGDGTKSAGTAKVLPAKKGQPAVIEVLGNHKYSSQILPIGGGGYLGAVVTLSRPGASSSTTTVEFVSPGNAYTGTYLTPQKLTARKGQSAAFTVATFRDIEDSASPTSGGYSAEIGWGDGTFGPGNLKVLDAFNVYNYYTSGYYDTSGDNLQSTIVDGLVTGRHVYRKAGITGVLVVLAGPQGPTSTTSTVKIK